MQKNYLLVTVVLCLASNSWSAHLITPKNCLPCILAANSIRRSEENSMESLLEVANDGEDDSLEGRYILDMEKIHEQARAAAFDALIKLHDQSDNVAIIHRHKKQRHDKRFLNCKFATLPVRHARAAEAREGQKGGKRRSAVSDLSLCHFKICNMGRKRNQRFIHSFNEYDN